MAQEGTKLAFPPIRYIIQLIFHYTTTQCSFLNRHTNPALHARLRLFENTAALQWLVDVSNFSLLRAKRKRKTEAEIEEEEFILLIIETAFYKRWIPLFNKKLTLWEYTSIVCKKRPLGFITLDPQIYAQQITNLDLPPVG